MRTVIVLLSTLIALLVNPQMPEWASGHGELQQQSCKDKGTC